VPDRANDSEYEIVDDSASLPGSPQQSVSRAVASLIESRVTELMSSDRLAKRKARRASRRNAFRRRLMRRWSDALDSLEELIAKCAELGDLVAEIQHDDSQLFWALDLLRSRAVQIGWEVHILASSGYADGAYARWRTLHELAVVSEFLREFGEDAAVRYLEHVHVKNRQVIREYNECCQNGLGYPAIPQSDVDNSERKKKQLLERHGPEFGKQLGWAAKWCGKKDPSFLDLREKVGYKHWKAHYGMANHAIHAGPHGVLFRLGHPLKSKPLPLSGPSLVGIGVPIHASAISLMHVTFSFISAIREKGGESIEDEFEITSVMNYILALARQAGEEVIAAQDHVEHEFGRR